MTHEKCFPGLIHVCLLFAVALALALPASASWKEKVLYSFRGGANDGAVPAGGVVFDKQDFICVHDLRTGTKRCISTVNRLVTIDKDTSVSR